MTDCCFTPSLKPCLSDRVTKLKWTFTFTDKQLMIILEPFNYSDTYLVDQKVVKIVKVTLTCSDVEVQCHMKWKYCTAVTLVRDIETYGCNMHVHGQAIKVKCNQSRYFSGTKNIHKNTNSDMSQAKPSSETLTYPKVFKVSNIPKDLFGAKTMTVGLLSKPSNTGPAGQS